MSWRAAVLVLFALALAGCGGSRPRPSHGGGTVGPRSGSGHHGGGVVDDISRPQSSRYRDRHDSVPPPIDVSRIPEPVPRVEPRSLYGNKSPYTVRGKSYRVLPSARGYDARGIASYYGAKFHGYKTSSLETYDMYAFSAAHKTLPLPSYARVTNLENGKSVIVRINDRGPFHENRLIDLSYAAAVKIGIWPSGTGRVEVRAIDPAHPEQDAPAEELTAQAAVPPGSAHAAIWLQVGAFADLDNADRVASRLRSARLAPVQVSDVEVDGRDVRRVRVGPLDADQADRVTEQIERLGLPRPQVAVD